MESTSIKDSREKVFHTDCSGEQSAQCTGRKRETRTGDSETTGRALSLEKEIVRTRLILARLQR